MNFEIGEGVYAIRCSATNSYYYGNTNDIRTRYSKHNWYLKRGQSVYNAYLPVLGYDGKQKELKDAVVRNDYTDIIVRNYLQEVA